MAHGPRRLTICPLGILSFADPNRITESLDQLRGRPSMIEHIYLKPNILPPFRMLRCFRELRTSFAGVHLSRGHPRKECQ